LRIDSLPFIIIIIISRKVQMKANRQTDKQLRNHSEKRHCRRCLPNYESKLWGKGHRAKTEEKRTSVQFDFASYSMLHAVCEATTTSRTKDET